MRRLALAGVTMMVMISRPGQQTPADYPLRPVPFTKVTVSDRFWAPRIEISRTVTIPAIFRKNEETGRVDNFAVAGRLVAGQYKGQRYNDTDVYKAIEGASYLLAVHPDPRLENAVDTIITKIAAAQEPDGYLFTARTADPEHPQPGIGATRWSELAVSHELYNAGHLYEAAVAHFEATGKRTLLEIAIRNANLVASVFGSDRRHGFPGHQEIEIGLVKLYRVTGDRKHLDLAKYFLDQRGRDVKLTVYPPGSRFAIYNDPVQIQAHKPVLEQDEAVGHAVRAMYMYAGMADVAALTADQSYGAAIARLWTNVVSKKMYLTGGVGARHDRESFGADYELPNLTAYNETCAAIGSAFWNHRMFLLHGDARYLDVMERVIYNAVISGVSLEGNAFFYPNPLESDGRYKFNQGQLGRATWFDVACCPGNICRFIPSMPGYIYASSSREPGIYVNLFVGSRTTMEVGGQHVALRQDTRYPWDGAVRIAVEPERAADFTVYVRIPGWAHGVPVPGGLYRFLDDKGSEAKILPTPFLDVNGRPVPLDIRNGFARVHRRWSRGDVVGLTLPMPVRRVVASDAVQDDAGKVALERGPIVYCAEWPDNGGRVRDLVLPDTARLTAAFRPDLLGGVVVITGRAKVDNAGATSQQTRAGERPFLAIPYYAWANRGPGEMAVWIRRGR